MKQKTLFIFLCITLGGIQPTQSQQKIDNEWWYEQRGVYVMEDYDGHKGCRSKEKEIIVPCQFDEIIFGDIAMSVEKDGKFGVYGYDGKLIYDVIYDEKIYFIPTRKAYPLYLGSKVGAGDTEGNILVPIEYEYVTEAVAGEKDIFLVNKGGRIKPNSYKSIDDVVGGKWGYYAYGQEIIPCQYDRAGQFGNDVATVTKDGQATLLKNPLKDPDLIRIAQIGNVVSAGKKRDPNAPAVSRYPAPNSDVDTDIPTNRTNDHTTLFAFIIANENYPQAPVPYALNDGRIFKAYCQQTLGLPQEHIRMWEDATFGTLIAAVQQMKDIADAYDGKARFILYYAGHGVPDDKGDSAYLLPVDGNSTEVNATGYSLARLYQELGEMPAENITVFLDACFSGAKREDEMLSTTRGVAIKVQEEAPRGNMVVFSAATGDETAHQYTSKGHGLFTYFLLKGLKQSNGNITLGELSEYVTKQVKRQSVVVNYKKQTPTVIPSEAIQTSWSSIQLK